MRRWQQAFLRRAFLVVMALGCALMAWASLDYADLELLPPFAIERLPVRFEELWLASLRVHVASALLSFPLCLVLMTRWLQRRRLLHRWLGRATGVLLLVAVVPSGVVLAFEAKGGAVVTAGFLLSAAIVVAGTWQGVLAARRSDLVGHAHAMRHVVAQMSVAVTSRLLLVGLDVIGVEPELAYVVGLWGPVLASAAVAEWGLRRWKLVVPKPLHIFERNPS